MDYDPDNSFDAVTEDGELIKVTKYGYKQEIAFVSEDGKTWLQNATTLELHEEDIDEELVDERPVPVPAGVIMSTERAENRKAKVPDPKAGKRVRDHASEREHKEREEREKAEAKK